MIAPLSPDRPRRRRVAWPLFAFSLAALTAVPAVAAPVLPTGGQVAAGAAAISPGPFGLTINQTTTRAVIDWRSFSIGAGGQVAFNNGAGATLNRVTGFGASQIDGALLATGSVFLLNPGGVIIGKGGQVSVGGTFIASTLAMSNKDFMAGGDLTFSGSSAASVINQGAISASGGDIALIGATVENDGTITAPGGTAALAAGHTVVLLSEPAEKGKISVVLGGSGTSATNAGLIEAASAELKANGGDVFALAVNRDGGGDPTGIKSDGGRVFLIADEGSVTARGEIDAPGGFVETSGASVDFTGLKVVAANWLIDPITLTVDQSAADTISSDLASAGVTLKTAIASASGPGNQSPGAGDIIIDAPISWSSANLLTLDAYHGIQINAPIIASGPGKVTLTTNDGGSGGDYGGVKNGRISFTGTPGSGQALTINGTAYTLLYSPADIAAINNDLTGHYALATSIDFDTPTPLGVDATVYGGAPIAPLASSPFTGVFEGLGNSLTNLRVFDVTPVLQQLPDGYYTNGLVGLFGSVGAGGVVRDLSIVASEMHGGDGMQVGTVAGALAGELLNVHVFDDGQQNAKAKTGNTVLLGSTSTFIFADAGGLVGSSEGVIVNSSATNVNVVGGNAAAGGLVGFLGNGGSISGSHADASVDVGDAVVGGNPALGGGLVGDAAGFDVNNVANAVSITNSYANGNVTGGGGVGLGGFAGAIQNGVVSNAYATGSVTANSPAPSGFFDSVGGFAGIVVNHSVVTHSWAGGFAQVPGAAVGSTLYSAIGGFTGGVSNSQVSDAYSTTAVSSVGTNLVLKAGFAGFIVQSGSVDQVYASGPANGGNGLVAVVGSASGPDTSGTLSNAYWDEGTTGATTGYFLAGTGAAPNVTGIGGSTGINPYLSATYGNFNLANWYISEGETRPILMSEYSTNITNAHQLQLMQLNLSASYTLTTDIDASETANVGGVWNTANGFVPVGQSDVAAFGGQLDGRGHTISHLTIHAPQGPQTLVYGGLPNDGAAGLFGFVGPTGVIQSFSINQATVTAGDGMAVGILAGASLGQVNKVAVIGSVTAGSIDTTNSFNAIAVAGGLIGFSDGQISGALAGVGLTAGHDAYAGGLVGATFPVQQASSITGSFAFGSVFVDTSTSSGGSIAGGLVGILEGSGAFPATITGSHAKVQVHGISDAFIGGFAGDVIQGQISTSDAAGAVSFTTGASSFEDIAGGFAGAVDTNSTITTSWSSGPVSAPAGVEIQSILGGFAGVITGSVNQSYTTSPVTISSSGNAYLGGFAGFVAGTVDQVYATGPETAAVGTQQGGLAGLNAGTFSNSYWDQTTTTASAAFAVNTGSTPNINSVSGSGAYDPASYGNFDLNITWFMIAGETRPFLRAEHSTTITNDHQLQLMAMDPTANYTVAVNFDASDTNNHPAGMWNPANGFVPIGGNGQGAFTGTFNGQLIGGANSVISGLTIIDTTATFETNGVITNGVVGLFGWSTGTIENVNLTGATVIGGDGMRVGILAGSQSGLVQNVHTDGSVFVGNKTSNLSASLIIAGAGGLVGVSSGAILNSNSDATVTSSPDVSPPAVPGGDAYVGGLVGSLLSGGAVTGSWATGAVTVTDDLGFANSPPTAGGLIGNIAAGATVANSYATGDVSGGAGSVLGGFAGSIAGQVTFSYATGNVFQSAGGTNGQSDIAGGFAGVINGTVSQSYTNGNIATVGGPNAGLPTLAGGFAGDISGGQVTNAFSSPVITISGSAFSDAGGFAGVIDTGGAATNTAEAFGSITSTGTEGGLVGVFGAGGGSLTDSYFDEGALGPLNTVGGGSGTVTHSMGFGGSTGLDPHDPNTFVGWDFTNVWAPPDANNLPGLYGLTHELRVSFDNFSFTYGSFPTYHVSFYGFQYGDDLHSINFDSGGNDTDGISFGGATTSSSGYFSAGNWALTFVNPSANDTGTPEGVFRVLNPAGTMTVIPRTLTVGLVGTVEKTYDGGVAATLTAANFGALTGSIVAGDSVSFTPAAGGGSFASKNVGSNIVVTASGLTLTGADAQDYAIQNDSASGAIGIIGPAALVISAVSQTRTYDGATDSTATPLVSGLVGGDTISSLSQSYDSKNVGQRTLTVGSGFVVNDGNGGNNYSVTLDNAAGSITPASLIATLTGTVQKTYDGGTSASLNASNYLLSGVISGDSVSLNDPSSGTYDTASPGTGKTVTVNGIQLLGADASNYTVNGFASGPVGVITPQQTVNKDDPQVTVGTQASPIIANNIDTISSDAANSVSGETGAAGGGDAGKSHGGIVSVFPVGEGPANEKAAADTSPVLGGGNSDLWSGGEEAPAVECPVGPSGKVSCEARP